MKSVLLFIFFTFHSFLLFANTAPVLSNISVLQRTDGSKLVDIYYDVYDNDSDTLEIILKVSNNEGLNWNVELNNEYLSGDIGLGVISGTSKHIIWDAGLNIPEEFSINYRFNVIADDLKNQIADDFEWCNVPAGNYTFGYPTDDNNYSSILSLDYDFQIMKYDVTNSQYCQFLQEALAVDSIYISGNDVMGYFTGDDRIPAGDQIFYSMGLSHTYLYGRIIFNNGQFETDVPAAWVQGSFDNHPVNYLTWFGAWAFARFYGLTLPNEFEWEKSARGMTGDLYPYGSTLSSLRVNYFNSDDPWDNGTTPVGYYNGNNPNTLDSPSPYGVYDMSGNVSNWLNGYYDLNNIENNNRLIKGGNWQSNNDTLKSYHRAFLVYHYYSPAVGFRCLKYSN